MITEDKIHAVLSKLQGLDLSEWPEVVDDEFVERAAEESSARCM